jgi:hypothetical protein
MTGSCGAACFQTDRGSTREAPTKITRSRCLPRAAREPPTDDVGSRAPDRTIRCAATRTGSCRSAAAAQRRARAAPARRTGVRQVPVRATSATWRQGRRPPQLTAVGPKSRTGEAGAQAPCDMLPGARILPCQHPSAAVPNPIAAARSKYSPDAAPTATHHSPGGTNARCGSS